jgi:hypothetical protein
VQVLEVTSGLLLVVGDILQRLQQLQAQGHCILQGPPEPAHTALHDLLHGTLATVTQEFEDAVFSCEEAVKAQHLLQLQHMAATGQNSSDGPWG